MLDCYSRRASCYGVLLGRGCVFFVAAGTSRKDLQKATAGYAPVAAEVVEEEPRTQIRCASSPVGHLLLLFYSYNAWTTLPHGGLLAYRV